MPAFDSAGCRQGSCPLRFAAAALATEIGVLGPEAGMALAEKMEGVEALIVAGDGAVRVSTGLTR